MPAALYLDLLNSDLYFSLKAKPNRLETLIPPGFKEWIVIDEVQKIPELLSEVHRLIESKKLRFILTGSSARTLKRAGVDLLAGRALRYTMHPLTPPELGKDFELDHALNFGLLPMTFLDTDKRRYLSTYVQTYLKEEVLQEGLVRNLGTFTRFLEAASFSQGQILNFSDIAREMSIDRQMVTSYFGILEDLLLSIRLLPFTKRAKRELIAHPKFYFFDAGVYRTIRPKGPLDSPSEISGAGLETIFLQCVRALNDYYSWGYDISFWRTKKGVEVDFVLYGERGFHAIEVKHTREINSKMLKGLKQFSEDYPSAKCIFAYMGTTRQYDGNIQIIPMRELLEQLPIALS
jgi:predicted AAA+ superfamily ATPase